MLLPPHQVRPYVRRNKTDRTDTKGILEAFRNADIRPVPIKSAAQQTLTTLHRLRSGWMRNVRRASTPCEASCARWVESRYLSLSGVLPFSRCLRHQDM